MIEMTIIGWLYVVGLFLTLVLVHEKSRSADHGRLRWRLACLAHGLAWPIAGTVLLAVSMVFAAHSCRGGNI